MEQPIIIKDFYVKPIGNGFYWIYFQMTDGSVYKGRYHPATAEGWDPKEDPVERANWIMKHYEKVEN